MASSPPTPPRYLNGASPVYATSLASASTPTDPLFLQTLMSRLQLRPPFLDTNSFLSHSLDDFLLHLPDDDFGDEDGVDGDGEVEDDLSSALGDEESRRRRLIAKEEAKLEKEIIRIIHSDYADASLKPNSGQSVSIGDHSICVGFQEEPSSEYRVWEWHGHIMIFDYDEGYSAEYVYGNFFEKVADNKCSKKMDEKKARDLGLRDLIGDSTGSVGDARGRVLHRNSLNGGRH